MGAFLYPHLPAQNLGLRDPFRPAVSGGIGAGIFIFVAGGADGDTMVLEVTGSVAAQIATLESDLELTTLGEQVTLTELVGYALAQSLMVGVGSEVQVTAASIESVALLAGSDDAVELTDPEVASTTLTGTPAASSPLEATTTKETDMMGSDDTETGVA